MTTTVKERKPRIKRTEHAEVIDKAIRADKVISPTDTEGVAKWKEHPEQMDVQGVDTPPPKQAKKEEGAPKPAKPRKAKPSKEGKVAIRETEPAKAESYIISLDDNRSIHAKRIDQALLAKEVTTKRSKAGVARWRSHPNQMDVRGVDTPRRKGKPPTRAVIDRRGRYHKQRSGTVI
jgi:hypothetical protein